MFSEKVPSAGN